VLILEAGCELLTSTFGKGNQSQQNISAVKSLPHPKRKDKKKENEKLMHFLEFK
jgi:hypothetical protein